nr:MAG TPA: minor capsid component [Bacteriophage sp.]
MNDATAKGLSKGEFSIDHNRGFLDAVKHANEIFAAFKTHAMGKSMASKLLDDNGNLKPFDKWMKDISSISSHHVGSWLKTEYNTAVLRAHNAADWRSFMENKDIMPNLRWMPTTSPDAEAVHRGYWEKKLTLPVEHPFWNKHHPGDRWNCKCSLESTDDPASPDDILDDLPIEPAQRGLENNPGKDGKMFNDTHPYFPRNCNQCSFYKNRGFKNKMKTWFSNHSKNCFDCQYINNCLYGQEKNKLTQRAKEIRNIAKEKYNGKVLTHPQFQGKVTMSSKSIKEFLNQPHEFFKEKNELLLDIENVFRNSEYKEPENKKGRNTSKHNEDRDVHLFEISIKGKPSWLIVREYSDKSLRLYSISDSKNILKALKE